MTNRAKVLTISYELVLGLIRSRVYGVNQSQGKAILFLDSHCEVNKRWAEPLLHEIVLVNIIYL